MPLKLDFDYVKIWTDNINAAMALRTTTLPTIQGDLETKIWEADTKLAGLSSASPPDDKKRAFMQEVVWKLTKANELVTKLQQEDLLRLEEMKKQNEKIENLLVPLAAKGPDESTWDQNDRENYEEIQIAKTFIIEIDNQISENTKRMALCHRLAQAYEDGTPETFPLYWLSIAPTIVEAKDCFGFVGAIALQSSSISEAPSSGSGLEKFTSSYGALLTQNELVRYTLPGTKIMLEQNNQGIIADKTPRDVEHDQLFLAAIKMAHLLLLDKIKHPNKPICLKGGRDAIRQGLYLQIAIQIQAEEAGINLTPHDLVVDIPGWSTKFPSKKSEKSTIESIKTAIRTKLKNDTTDFYKDQIEAIKLNDVLEHEPLTIPRPC